MLIRLDTDSGEPLYVQIASGIRAAMTAGELGPGDRLPPARELASVLEVNMHTVLRAYTLLQDEGALTMRRGRGAVVAEGASRLHALLRAVVDEAQQHGISRADILTMLGETE